jgi:hypothetical protein
MYDAESFKDSATQQIFFSFTQSIKREKRPAWQAIPPLIFIKGANMSMSQLILSAIRQKSFKYYLLASMAAAILTYGVFAVLIFGNFHVAFGIAKLIAPACFLLVGLLCNFACAIFAQKQFDERNINDDRRDSLMSIPKINNIEDKNTEAYSFVKSNAHYQLYLYFFATFFFAITTSLLSPPSLFAYMFLLMQILMPIVGLRDFLRSPGFMQAAAAAEEDPRAASAYVAPPAPGPAPTVGSINARQNSVPIQGPSSTAGFFPPDSAKPGDRGATTMSQPLLRGLK